MCLHYIKQLLIEVADQSPQSHQYACVIVHRGKVISQGFNKFSNKFCFNGSYLL